MTSRCSVWRGLRTTGMVVSAAALTLAVLGCGEEAAPVAAPTAKTREDTSVKNMADFMKGKAASKPAAEAPKVQTK